MKTNNNLKNQNKDYPESKEQIKKENKKLPNLDKKKEMLLIN